MTCSGTYTVVQADLDADGVTNKASASLDGVTSNEATATVPWKAPQASIEPQVSIELAVQVTEDAGTAEVAVSLSESSLQTVTVDYATSDGTATAGTDYVASSSTLTFAPGITEQKIPVTVINDGVDEEEENETFTITLTGPNNASLDANSGTVTITDDDDPAVTANFGQASYSVDEGSTVEVAVTLNADPEREVAVLLTHVPQGGAGSADYSSVPGSLVFQIGDTEKSFTFTATADDIDDDGESVVLGFGTMPDRVTAGTTATVTITDDDTAGVTVSETVLSIDEGTASSYTVVLDTEPTASVTVAVAGHAGTDISLDKTSLTFTASTWDTAQTVTVTAGEDNDAASDAAVTLTHTANGGGYVAVQETVTVTIVEKDASVLSVGDAQAAEDGGNMVFTVSISAAAGQEVTVDYATSGVTATAGQDYTETTGTLTFAANSVASQTVSVPVTDDAVDEAEEETFTLTLSNAQVASLAQGGETLTVTGIITDDDDPAVTASFGQASYSVDEGNTVEVTVTLSADPEREVTVQLTHDPQGNTGSADYSGVPGSLVFQIGDTEKSFTFSAAADDIDDDGESVALAFGTLPDGVSPGTTATVSITDDDTRDLVISESSLGIDEGDATGETYTVKLATEPTGNVTVAISGHTGTDLSLDETSLAFTTADWDTARTVTVTAGRDDDSTDDGVTLTHTASGGGYNSITKNLAVTIRDDTPDSVTANFEQAAYTVQEGSSVTVKVKLSEDPKRSFTIPITKSNQDGASNSDYSGVPANVTFNSGDTEKSITFSATMDSVDDDGESVRITFGTMPTGVLKGAIKETVVSITDDDVPPVTVSFEHSTYTVAESDDPSTTELKENEVAIKVTLSAEPERSVTVSITRTGQGGATSADYSGMPDSVAFASAETEKSITFTAAGDDIDDDGESVKLTLGPTLPTGVSAGSTNEATVSITDDDTAGVTVSETALSIDEGGSGTYTVVLDTEPTDDVTVAVAGHSGTDISLDKTSLTFTASTWDTAQTVTVTAGEDNDAASDAAVTMTHTANGGGYVAVQETVTVTIVEKDASVLSVGDAQAAEDGGNMVFTVSISAAAGQEVTVEYATSNGTATAGQDYTETTGTLTFAANSVASQTVSVPVTDDAGGRGRGGDLHADAEQRPGGVPGRRVPRPWRPPGPSPTTTTRR